MNGWAVRSAHPFILALWLLAGAAMQDSSPDCRRVARDIVCSSSLSPDLRQAATISYKFATPVRAAPR
jgi:hypothetical protein